MTELFVTKRESQQMQQISRRMRPDEEVGRSGLIQYGGWIDDEWLRELSGKRGVKNYREMSDMDSTIGMSQYLIKVFLRQVPWTAEPAPDSGDAGQEWADRLTEVMHDMEHTWDEVMGEAASMTTFGWVVFEKVYKLRRGRQPKFVFNDEGRTIRNPQASSKYDDGLIGIAKLARRSQDSLDRWQYDDEDRDILGMWQQAAPAYLDVFIPMSKLLHLRTESNKDNPEGRSMLRNAFRSYFYLKRFQELEGVGAERDATGMVVLEVPYEYLLDDASPEKKALVRKFKRLLQSIKRNENEGIMFPSEFDRKNMPTGFKIRLLESGGSRQFDFDKVIQRYQRNIAQTMLTQFLFLGMDGVGSFALSDDQTNIFAVAMGAILGIIESETNRDVITEWCELAGCPAELQPKWKHGDLENMSVQKFADAVSKGIAGGILTPDVNIENSFRTLLGLDPISEDDWDDTDTVDDAGEQQQGDEEKPDVDEDEMDDAEKLAKKMFGGGGVPVWSGKNGTMITAVKR